MTNKIYNIRLNERITDILLSTKVRNIESNIAKKREISLDVVHIVRNHLCIFSYSETKERYLNKRTKL